MLNAREAFVVGLFIGGMVGVVCLWVGQLLAR